jgi:hypothetical protein
MAVNVEGFQDFTGLEILDDKTIALVTVVGSVSCGEIGSKKILVGHIERGSEVYVDEFVKITIEKRRKLVTRCGFRWVQKEMMKWVI